MDGGGSSRHVGAPRTLDVQQFANARGAEVQALYAVLKNHVDMQPVVKNHLRRRTASHSRRRSFHWDRKKKKKRKRGALDEGTEGIGGEGVGVVEGPRRMPCRRVRRRIELKGDEETGGGGCARDGTQRLVTHVWHAKRFSMTKIWSHWLPEGPPGRGRGSRALFRWVKEAAVLQDASFFSPIELQGNSDAILEVLQMVLEPAPPSFSSMSDSDQAVYHGSQYGKAMLHHMRRFPRGAIAPVTIMWRPASQREAEKRQLWVWVHAAAFDEALSCLLAACESQVMTEKDKLQCWSRKGKLGRLDLLGTDAAPILRKVLHTDYRQASHDVLDEASSSCAAFSVLSSSRSLARALELPGGTVLGMEVGDPRESPRSQLKFQPSLLSEAGSDKERTKDEVETCPTTIEVEDMDATLAVSNDEAPSKDAKSGNEGLPCLLEGQLSDSPGLWDLHSDVTVQKIVGKPLTEKELSTRRHKQRLCYFHLNEVANTPQQDVENSPKASKCPILLLKHEHQRLSACGYSLIMPIAWVRAFWVPLVFAGGHVIGLRDRHWLYTDAGLPSFPHDYPDCSAYNQYMARQALQFQETYNKRPPSKRGLHSKVNPLWQFAYEIPLANDRVDSSVDTAQVPVLTRTLSDTAAATAPVHSSSNHSGAFDPHSPGNPRAPHIVTEGAAQEEHRPDDNGEFSGVMSAEPSSSQSASMGNEGFENRGDNYAPATLVGSTPILDDLVILEAMEQNKMQVFSRSDCASNTPARVGIDSLEMRMDNVAVAESGGPTHLPNISPTSEVLEHHDDVSISVSKSVGETSAGVGGHDMRMDGIAVADSMESNPIPDPPTSLAKEEIRQMNTLISECLEDTPAGVGVSRFDNDAAADKTGLSPILDIPLISEAMEEIEEMITSESEHVSDMPAGVGAEGVGRRVDSDVAEDTRGPSLILDIPLTSEAREEIKEIEEVVTLISSECVTGTPAGVGFERLGTRMDIDATVDTLGPSLTLDIHLTSEAKEVIEKIEEVVTSTSEGVSNTTPAGVGVEGLGMKMDIDAAVDTVGLSPALGILHTSEEIKEIVSPAFEYVRGTGAGVGYGVHEMLMVNDNAATDTGGPSLTLESSLTLEGKEEMFTSASECMIDTPAGVGVKGQETRLDSGAAAESSPTICMPLRSESREEIEEMITSTFESVINAPAGDGVERLDTSMDNNTAADVVGQNPSLEISLASEAREKIEEKITSASECRLVAGGECKISAHPEDLPMFVVRTDTTLKHVLMDISLRYLPIFPGGASADALQNASIAQGLVELPSTQFREKGCLVRVLLRAPRRGVFDAGAIIYLPTSSDLNSYLDLSERWQGFQDPSFMPAPQNVLTNKKRRKEKGKGGKWKPSHPGSCAPTVQLQADSVKLTHSLRTPIGIVTSPLPRGSTSTSAVGICTIASLGISRARQMEDRRWPGTSDIFLLARHDCSSMYRPALASIVVESAHDLV